MNLKTQKRNAAFKTASKSERAVMVAKDALKMLNAGKTRAETGQWVNLKYTPEIYEEVQICDVSDGFKECSVCALGALMLSEIRHTNKLKMSDVGYEIAYQEHGHRLNKLFSKSQQKLMELVFEGGMGLFGVRYLEEDELAKIDRFYCAYEDDEGRLRAILKNVIKNNGKFVLPA